MPFFNPDLGFSGPPDPGVWASNRAAVASFRDAARGASLMLWPEAGQMGVYAGAVDSDTLIHESLEDIATTTRASKAWHPNWDFVSGSEVGPLVEFGNNKAVIGPGGLLVTGAIENRIANPRAEGAAIPAWPTGWSGSAPGGAITPVGRGTWNGWPYVDIEVDGTLSGTGYILPGQATAAASEAWTAATGLQIVSGSGPRGVDFRLTRENGTTITAANNILPREHRRYSLTGTMPAGTTGALCIIYIPPGIYSDLILRVFAPQLTKTGYPTPPVMPPSGTPGATTKAQDSCVLPIGGWYRHPAGTVVIEFVTQGLQGGVIYLDDGGIYGRSIIETGSAVQMYAAAGGVYTSLVNRAVPPQTRVIAAMTWSGRDHRGAINGIVDALVTTAFDVAAPTGMTIGYGEIGWADRRNRLLHRIRYFPRTMDAAELAEITTPHWSV